MGQRLNKIKHVKCLEQYLPLRKCIMNWTCNYYDFYNSLATPPQPPPPPSLQIRYLEVIPELAQIPSSLSSTGCEKEASGTVLNF